MINKDDLSGYFGKKAVILSRNDMRNIIVSDNIRKYRLEKCYTQEYMAREIDISQSAYYKIESGSVKITMERLTDIANILNKPLDSFLEKSISNQSNDYELFAGILQKQNRYISELEQQLKLKSARIYELEQKLSAQL